MTAHPRSCDQWLLLLLVLWQGQQQWPQQQCWLLAALRPACVRRPPCLPMLLLLLLLLHRLPHSPASPMRKRAAPKHLSHVQVSALGAL
jgi:hypothetical protein